MGVGRGERRRRREVERFIFGLRSLSACSKALATSGTIREAKVETMATPCWIRWWWSESRML